MNFKELFNRILKEEKETIVVFDSKEFVINNSEGTTSHFHFFKNGREGCVEITKDKSANHKPNHTEYLTNKEKRLLAYNLCLPFEKNNNYTKYQFAYINWNNKNIKANPCNKGAKLLDETEKRPLAYLKYLTSEDIEELKKIPNSAFDPKFEK